jgi:uncharacterized integral membrane protein
MADNKDDEVMILIEDNVAAMTSKLKADFVNILPTTPASKEDRLLTLYEFSEKNQNKDCQTETSDASNEISYRRDKLLKSIKENKKKLNTSLYIISSKYDLIYFRYNRISLLILIVSTITTFIEAIRLTLINYQNDTKDNQMQMIISKETISLIISMFSLFLGTLLTILSSIVKFRNYRENMEKLKNIHDVLFNYKIMYNKQLDLIEFFTLSNNLTIDLFEKLVENVETINKEIKDINIFENIRIKDIIKFNKIKADHDVQLKKLSTKKELDFLKLTIESTRNKCLFEKQTNEIEEDVNNLNKNKVKCF